MKFSELKKLQFNKETLKKVDTFIKKETLGSPDYYKALCLKGAILHSLGKDEEAIKLLLELEGKIWVLQQDEVISLCDTLISIFLKFDDPERALKYINIKKEHLDIVHKEQYFKDMIVYYNYIKDKENEKRYILMYLDETIDPKERLFGFERIIEFQYEEHDIKGFDASYDKLLESYNQLNNDLGINHINYLRASLLLYQNLLDDLFKFCTEKINEPIASDDLKLFYASQIIKYHLSKDELRKASIVDGDYGELLNNASLEIKRDYLNTIHLLYSTYGNKSIVQSIEEQIELLNSVEVPQKTKEQKKYKKIEIQDPIIVPKAQEARPQPVEPDVILTAEPSLLAHVSEAYFALNEALEALSMEALQIREPIRKSLLEIEKKYKFKECHIIYDYNTVYDGYQYKDGRLYDKHFKNKEAIEKSIPIRVMKSGKEYLNDNIDNIENNIDIITTRKSIYKGVISYPLCSNGKSFGSVSYYFDDIDFSLEFEILKTYSFCLSNKIDSMLYKNKVNDNAKYVNELLKKIPFGIKTITDEYTTLNDTCKKIYNVNFESVDNEGFYDIVSSKDRANYKALITSFYGGKIKEATLIYRLYDGRAIKEQFYLYELTDHIIINSIVLDVTNDIKQQQNLNERASLDSLTPLKGFRGFEEDILTLNHEKKYSIMLFDAKNFKLYFDIYGLKFHNDLIKAIGLKMLDLKDKYQAYLYHYDSDKFIVILKMNDERSTIKKFKEFLDELSQKLFELNYRVKLSFKGSILRVLGKSPDYDATKIIEMLSNSLGALKEESGFNDVAYHNSKLADARFYDFQMELHISEAIDKGLLEVCYTQIANMKEKGTFAYMAHLNLSNAIVSDAYFEAVIKKRNLFLQTDKYLITHSLMELKEFYKEYGGYYNLFVPVHHQTIEDKGFIAFYYEKMKLLHINPKYVYIEVIDDRFDFRIDADDLKYINLCTRSLDMAFRYYPKLYVVDYNQYDLPTLNIIKDALKLYGVDILVDDVSSNEQIEGLIKEELYIIRGSALKKIYKIKDIIALLSTK